MKSRINIFIISIFIAIFLHGCGKKSSDDCLMLNKMLLNMQTYTVIAEIITQGNKVIENYEIKQYYKYPDKYRLEVLSPSDRKGKTTICDGSNVYIYHPLIKQFYTMENIKNSEDSIMFPGYFAGNMFTREDAQYEFKIDNAVEYIAVRVGISNTNSYRKSQILYFDRKLLIPVKLEVLDSKDNVLVTVYYKNFIYNAKIDENIFKKENIQKPINETLTGNFDKCFSIPVL